jgi:serine/threonine-protein kinase
MRSPATPISPQTRVASEAVARFTSGTDRRGIVRAMYIGLWTWPSFTLLDLYMCYVAFPDAPFSLFFLYRVVIELVLFAVYWAAIGNSVRVERLFRWQGAAFASTAFTISLMAIHLGGIRSPYMHGISLVALVWAATVPTDWRRALPPLLAIALAFPIVMAIGAVVSPPAREAWLTSEALIVFSSNYVFVVSSCTLALIICHLVWSAQQQTRKIGSYELEAQLGRGGMGEVWQARHHLLVRRAAIKVIRPEVLGGDPKTREMGVARFQREAQATAMLRSPHTVALYDFGLSDKGDFYYVMELLDGCDAQQLVTRFGPQPVERVVYLLAQMCDSLGEAHANDLVHRDIKPSNVHICRMGQQFDFVKVLDFGMVKFSHTKREQTMISGTHATGTPAYMAPEMILGDRPVDARADIYAVGCLAYFLLTGRLVFEAENSMAMLLRHVQEMPSPPSSRTELVVPKEMDDLVLRCLEKDPAMRPASMDEFLSTLSDCPLSERWTAERAKAWWQQHLPA